MFLSRQSLSKRVASPSRSRIAKPDATFNQLSLPGLDAAAPPFQTDAIARQGVKLLGYTLFLAILPDLADAHRLAQAAANLQSQHELGKTPLPSERLHISLHEVASFIDSVSQAVVDAAISAASRVTCPLLPIVFDHVLSFNQSNAFVLRCNPQSDLAIARLRHSLTLELRRAGLHPRPSQTPHMTMLYAHHHVAQHAIEPIGWTATRFALILSHVGLGHHQKIAEWALVDHP